MACYCLTKVVQIKEILQFFLEERLEWTEFLEMLALLAGEKNVVRFTGNQQRLRELGDLAERLNLPFALAPLHLENIFNNSLKDSFCRLVPGYPTGVEEGILFLGAEKYLAASIDLEESGCQAKEAARLYGYPQCCATKYEKSIQNGKYTWLDSFLENLRGIQSFPWPMNRFGRLFAPFLSSLPDYFPCSPTCGESLRLAKNYYSLLQRYGMPQLADLVQRHLAQPVLKHGGCLFLLMPLYDKPYTGTELKVMARDVYAYAGTPPENVQLTLHFDSDGIFLCETGIKDSQAILLLFE